MMRRSSNLALVMVFSVAIGGGKMATAAAYYTVTDLGRNWSEKPVIDATGQIFLENRVTGESIPYPSSNIDPKTVVQESSLPREYFYERATNDGQKVAFRGLLVTANILGNAIVAYPAWYPNADPYSSLGISFLRKLPDGSYGDNFFIDYGNRDSVGAHPFSFNSKDQLVWKDAFVDFDKNTFVLLNQLIAPEVLTRYGQSIYGLALSENGTIFAKVANYPDNSYSPTYLLLTPPELSVPVPTPEPTTLAVLTLGLVGIAFRRHRGGKLREQVGIGD